MEEIGGLIVDAFKSAAKARAAAQKSGRPAPAASEVLRRIFIGDPNRPIPAAAAPAQTPRPAPQPVRPAPAPPVAAVAVHPPGAPLLADFHEPRRFLAAFVLAEALGPPVGLR